MPTDELPICEGCGSEPAEWLDEYCQDCWECECSRGWWALVRRAARAGKSPMENLDVV